MTCTGAHPDCYTGGPRCPCAHPPSSWGSIAWPSIKAPPVEPDAHDRRDHDPGDEDEPAAEHLTAMRRRHRERLASNGLGRLELRPEAYA